jgi:DNA primase large subunit
LKQKIRQYGRTEDELNQIMEHSDTNNFQIACQRYFEFSHKADDFVSINHPNQYFEQSQRIVNPNNKTTKMYNMKTEHVKIEMTQ